MSFFGPGGLGGVGGQSDSLDPKLVDALMQQFPGLAQMGQQQQQAPNALQGYQFPGVQFFSGQGQGGFANLSPFEGAKGMGSESITAGLALGNYGKSSTQSQGQPAGGAAQPFSLGQLSLPSLSLPQQVASQQGGGDEGMMSGPTIGGESNPGTTINAGDVLGAGQTALNMFGGPNLGNQTTTPGFAEQRKGERDYSWETGAPSGIPQIGAPGMGGIETGGLGPTPSSNAIFDEGGPTMSAPGGSGQFALGEGGTPAAVGGDWLGGGISTLGGLANLAGGIQSGNPASILSGAGSTLTGIGQMFPGSGLAGSGLELVGGAIGSPMAALGLVQAIDEGDPMAIASNLASLYGTTVPVINAMFGTALPTLTSLAGSALSAIGSTIGGTVGSTIGSLGASLGGGVGAGVGTAAGEAVASTVAGTTAALPLGMVMGPYVVAKLIQAWQAMGPDKANARQLGNRVEDVYGQLPGMLSYMQGVPGISGQLTPDSTPEQAADILKQLNSVQDMYQTGGWEAYQKTGETGVTSVGEGNMKADLSQVQTLLDQQRPYMQMMDLNRLRAQDVLGKAGWSPEQITQQAGRYVSPEEWAMNLNAQSYNGGSAGTPQYQDFNPTFNSQFRPQTQEALLSSLGMTSQQLNDMYTASQNPGAQSAPLPGGYDLNTVMNMRSGAGLQQTPYGMVDSGMLAQLQGIAPGNMEQGLNQFLQQYGGVNPGMMEMGFGKGLQAAPVDPMTQQLQQYQQQLGQLQGGLGQVTQGLQQQETAGIDPGVLAALQQQSPGFGGAPSTGGGNAGVDLQALLRQLGLAA